MKVFHKLYIGIVSIIAISLIVFGYFIIFADFNKRIRDEVDAGTKRHVLLAASLVNESRRLKESGEEYDYFMAAAWNMRTNNPFPFNLYDSDKKLMYQGINATINVDLEETEHTLYKEITEGDKRYLVFMSGFGTFNNYYIVTVSDITNIYEDSAWMRQVFVIVYLVTIAVTLVFAYLFARYISKRLETVNKASMEMASGDYSKRIGVDSNDEFAEMADTYNKMAATIEEKIAELEDSVRRREEFTGAFSHELKTPMTSIVGYADMIYHEDMSKEEIKKAASFILNEGIRLQSLALKLQDVIALGQSELDKMMVDSEELFEDLKITFVQKAKDSEVEIGWECDPEYIDIEYDLFKTVIVNLIDNAFKSGTKKIEVRGVKLEKTYDIRVKDYGRGIPESEIEKVKEAFYMVDKSRSRKAHGAGLGLALCDKIVSLHGGKLDIQSIEGTGTTVTVSIPLYIEEGDPDGQTSS